MKKNSQAMAAQGTCAVKKVTKKVEFSVAKGDFKKPILERILRETALTTVDADIVDALEATTVQANDTVQTQALARLPGLVKRLDTVAQEVDKKDPHVARARVLVKALQAWQAKGTTLPNSVTPEEAIEDLSKEVVAVEQRERLEESERVSKAEKELSRKDLSTEERQAREKTVSRANKKVDQALAEEEPDLGPALVPVTKLPAYREAATLLETLMGQIGEAMKWQDDLVKEKLEAEKELPTMRQKERQLQANIRNLQFRLNQIDYAIRNIQGAIQYKTNLLGRCNPRTARDVQNEIRLCQRDLGFAMNDLATQQGFLDTAVREVQGLQIAIADAFAVRNRHGSGRHGAQTGLEQQARRAGTGGTTADQDGNEMGLSRDHYDEDTGNPVQKITWNKVDVKWTEGENGQRVVTTQAKELVLAAESRFQSTDKSSWFLSPALEKEAVDRAVKAAKDQVDFDEVWDNGWRPLDSIAIVVGKPAKAKGYGHGVRLAGGTTPLATANQLLDQFRRGKLTPDELLKALHTELRSEGVGKGATLLPHVRVVLKRGGSGWKPLTWFPTDEPVGCMEAGAWARKQGLPPRGAQIPNVVA